MEFTMCIIRLSCDFLDKKPCEVRGQGGEDHRFVNVTTVHQGSDEIGSMLGNQTDDLLILI